MTKNKRNSVRIVDGEMVITIVIKKDINAILTSLRNGEKPTHAFVQRFPEHIILTIPDMPLRFTEDFANLVGTIVCKARKEV